MRHQRALQCQALLFLFIRHIQLLSAKSFSLRMLVSNDVFVRTGVFIGVEASSKDVFKDVSHPRLLDVSEK